MSLGLGVDLKVIGHIRQTTKLTNEQLEFEASLGYEQMRQYERQRLRWGIVILRVSSLDELKSLSHSEIVQRMENSKNRISQHGKGKALISVRFLLRKCGLHYKIERSSARQYLENNGAYLSESETVWARSQEDEIRRKFIEVKEKFRRWCEERFGETKRFTIDVPFMAMRVARVVGFSQDLKSVSLQVWKQALISVILEATKDWRSLGGQRRQSRCTSQFGNIPGQRTARHYTSSVLRFLEFMGYDHTELGQHLSINTITRSVQGQLAVCETDLPPVHDVLSVEEMSSVLGAASDPKERLIISFLCHLGMRSGAIRNLRLDGVVESHSKDAPRWEVRRYIKGVDKGNQVNTWDAKFVTMVHECLDRYIHEYWRKYHEEWIWNMGEYNLRTTYLFPSKKKTEQEPMSSCGMYRTIIRVMKRAGVTGRHAHPHSFRKGVVTALLNEGNPLRSVSQKCLSPGIET